METCEYCNALFSSFEEHNKTCMEQPLIIEQINSHYVELTFAYQTIEIFSTSPINRDLFQDSKFMELAYDGIVDLNEKKGVTLLNLYELHKDIKSINLIKNMVTNCNLIFGEDNDGQTLCELLYLIKINNKTSSMICLMDNEHYFYSFHDSSSMNRIIHQKIRNIFDSEVNSWFYVSF